MCGQPLTEFLADSSQDVFANAFSTLLRGGEVAPFEVCILNPATGECLYLELALRILSEDGIASGFQGIARDITERRALEGRLLQAQKMEAIGTLAGGIAHDFNNLLTVITGYCQLLREHVTADTEAAEDIGEIDNAARRAAALTNHLLTFSRRHGPRRGVVDLNFAVRGIERMLRRVIGAHIQLKVSIAHDAGPIVADPSQLDQILMNLAVNARDAMPNGGTLTFRTADAVDPSVPETPLPAGRYTVLEVEDTGCGMDQKTIARIFEPFFTTKEVGRGTGLGLSTVYGIIQESGGGISVRSTPGSGTAFRLYFPVAEKGLHESHEEVRLEQAMGSETILLVEDDDGLRLLASKILSTCGYKLLLASRPDQARELLDDFKGNIDLMVTDLMMPGGTGTDLMQHASRVRPQIKMFAISGYHDTDLPTGVILLAKPFSPIELAARVRDHLDA